MQGGVADQPFAELHRLHRLRIVAVPDRDLHLEHLRLLVQQRDAEDAVVDQPLDQVGEPRQQLVGVEDRAHLAADLGQRLERLRVLALRFEQPRVGDGLRDVRAELAQDPLVALGERAEAIAQQVERADHLALVPQRHGQLRLRARHHRQVARVGVHVVEQDRPLLGHGGADRALADLQREMLDDLVRIAHGVGDAQLFAPLVEQIHREHREAGEPRDQVRDLSSSSSRSSTELTSRPSSARIARSSVSEAPAILAWRALSERNRGQRPQFRESKGRDYCAVVRFHLSPRVYLVTQSWIRCMRSFWW